MVAQLGVVPPLGKFGSRFHKTKYNDSLLTLIEYINGLCIAILLFEYCVILQPDGKTDW